MKKILMLTWLVLSILPAVGQKKNLVLHYDFQKVQGNVVKDKSKSHVDAVLMGDARVENGCLLLKGENAYLDMTERAGLVASQLADFTVCVTYRLDEAAQIKGYGHFLWCFSQLEANRDKEGPYHAYRINEQRVETSIGGYTQETGIQKSMVSEKGKWITVVFRQQDRKGELFIDGQLVGTETGFPLLKDIFQTAPRFNWIGRPPFNGDKYLKDVQVSDYRIYNVALTDKQLKQFGIAQ